MVENKKIIEAIQNDSLVIFVGSGLSKRFGLPDWKELVHEVINNIDKKEHIPLIQIMESGLMKPIQILEVIKNEHNEIHRYIKNKFNIIAGDFTLHKNILELSGQIVTTNYDNAFEKASNDEIIPTIYDSKFNLSEINRNKNPFILKLHGCFKDPEKCILFLNDYTNLYSGENAAIVKLKSIFTDKTILFLGFGLNDPEINLIFSNLDTAFGNNNKHFVITPEPNEFNKFQFLESIEIADFKELETIISNWLEFKKSLISTSTNTTEALSNPLVKDGNNEISIDKVMEVLNQEVDDLNYSSTKDDISRIHNLRIKVQEEYFKNIENQLDFIVSKQELMNSSILFDRIYTSEKIDIITANEIQKIRENESQSYKWYDRSIIVSAVTLSLMNFKFDQKKANILLDFIIDSEPSVWERALTGLIIAIIYQKNRSWLRADNFIKRLEILRKNDEIQSGIKCIDFILKNEIYKSNLINPNLFKLELFKNPMNCFVPFYENNEIFRIAIDNANNDFDVDEFTNYINEMPFMDSYKYALCVGLNEGGLKKVILDKDSSIKFRKRLILSDNLSPYQNLISEFYCFSKYFPEKRIIDFFDKQLLLTKTDLKTIILNRAAQLLLEANTFLTERKYPEAITKYRDLLKIDSTNKEARWQLASCYNDQKEYKKELPILLELEKENKSEYDKQLFQNIAICYYSLNRHNESNLYCEKIERKEKYLNFNLLHLKADNYFELNDFINSEIYLRKAEEQISNSNEMRRAGSIYNGIGCNDDAMRLVKKALEINPEDASSWLLQGIIYCDLFLWDLSISSIKKAKELDDEDKYTCLALGRSLLLSKINLKNAKQLFEKCLKSKELKGITFGNLGHLYLIEGDRDSAIKMYYECIQRLIDENDFNRKMIFDLRFMTRIGIIETDYLSIVETVIKDFQLTKKSVSSTKKMVHLH